MSTEYRPELTEQIEREKRRTPTPPPPELRQHGDWSGALIGLFVLAIAVEAIVLIWTQ